MCAAQLLNQSSHAPIAAVYGAVTTGTLAGTEVVLDLVEYHIESVAKILGILGNIVETA
jgi:hypothetical protein